ncbi:MAG: right-handed parallel beta-helix repeat-containing protein [Bacteroidetes bacterium]|nr:right-handed parallel beta-helix repeat-containing protein [Bacteroidota bacterium]
MRFSFLLFLMLQFPSAFSQWQVIPSGTTANLVDGCFVSDSVGFIVSSGGVVLKTTNQGSSWQVDANLQGVFTSICNSGPDTLYAGGNCIYRSTNQGASWTLMSTTNYTISDLGFFRGGDGFEIIPGTITCDFYGSKTYFPDYRVKKSADGGATWNSAFSSGEGGRFCFVNDHAAYVTGEFFEIFTHCSAMWGNDSKKTTDNGRSWTNFSQPSNWLSLISFFSEDTGYYVHDPYMIYKTLDGGATIAGSYTEIPDDGVHQCMFMNDNNGYLLSRHHIYITKSDGFAWDVDAATSDTLNILFKNPSDFLFGIGTNGLILKKHHVNFPHQDTVFRIRFSSKSVDFGYLAIDSNMVKSLKLTNTGTNPVTLTLASSGPYKISFANGSFTDSLHVVLELMQDTILYIRFNPSLAMSYPDSLHILSMNRDSVNLPISGIGFYGLYSDILKDTVICTDTLRIGANIIVADAAKLTICEGTQVRLMGNFSLKVNGILEALGDSLHPIRFGSFKQGASWKGITIYHKNLSDTSIFRYCNLAGECNNTSVAIIGGLVLIDHCNISNGYNPTTRFSATAVGVNAWSSAVVIMTNNKIFNTSGWAISCADGNQSSFLNNEIYGNGAGILWVSNNGATISGNRIHDNFWTAIHGSWHDIHNTGPVLIEKNKIFNNGGGIEWSDYSIWIKNNEIFNNESSVTGGISCDADSGLFIIQNLVYNNSVTEGDGGGVKLQFYYSKNLTYALINNTICNNRVMSTRKGNDVFASANYLSGPKLNLYNNIIYNLTDTNNISWTTGLDHTVDYNCIHQANAESLGQNNIISSPAFVFPTASTGVMNDLGSYSWALTGNSPCINTGDMGMIPYLSNIDITGSPRIVQGRVDIGAYEYPFPFSVDGMEANLQYSVFPNPAEDLLHVIVYNNATCTFTLYDLTSRKILEEKFILNVSLNIKNLSPGIYFYLLRNDHGNLLEGKVIKK